MFFNLFSVLGKASDTLRDSDLSDDTTTENALEDFEVSLSMTFSLYLFITVMFYILPFAGCIKWALFCNMGQPE